MFKKVVLLGLGGLLLLLVGTSVHAEVKPNCELGDAIFRPLNIPLGIGSGFGHAGIYFCSKSNPVEGIDFEVDATGFITKIDIQNSDLRHSVIQGNGYNPPPPYQQTDLVPLDVALAGLEYWGAYNCGSLDAEERRKIVGTAYQQRGAVYNHNDPNKIKLPKKNDPEGIGSFRCDGLVEYCYEQVVAGGFFTDEEEKNCWPSITQIIPTIWAAFFVKKDAFYPKGLMARMQKAEAYLPQVKSLKVYKEDGTEVGQYDWIEAGRKYIVKINVTDETKEELQDGSGIDKVV